MARLLDSTAFDVFSSVFVGAVWVFHGLWSKLLGGIPRHRRIVAKVLGGTWAGRATAAIGLGEIALGVWAWNGWERPACALAQTTILMAMNTLEIRHARELLISASGMLALNAAFLLLVWHWALA